MLGFRSVRVQGGDILSLTGTGMFWLKHWVGQATSVSCSAAQAVFEREHLREGEQKGQAQALTILFPVRLDSAAQPATLPRCLEGRPSRSQPVMVLRHLLRLSLSKD